MEDGLSTGPAGGGGGNDTREAAGDKDAVRQGQQKWGFVPDGLCPGLRRGQAGHPRPVSRKRVA